MIIYKDILSDDEIISDVYGPKEAKDGGGCLWEVDGAMVKPGQDSFVLEGANASAEGEDADEGEEGGDNAPVLNLARDFRYQKIDPPSSSKEFSGELKKYLKKVMKAMADKGQPAEKIDEFKKGAASALKHLTANFKDYDFYIGEGAEVTGEGDYMYVLVNFRDDGVTPFATIWKHALIGMKV